MAFKQTRILILCKTYPSPSARHAETSCVAGVTETGSLIRLFPVPFRLIEDGAQFKKWQWITARVEKAQKDHRPESYCVAVDTITCDGPPIGTKDNWRDRREHLKRITKFDDFGALEANRVRSGETLGLLRPSQINQLEISPSKSTSWTTDELRKLLQLQQQGNLFDDTDRRSIATLKKVPYDFHYQYTCTSPEGERMYRHKIVDWEVGALYWNVRRTHGENWEAPFRSKLEKELATRDLMFLMGTIHRFPDQWLIASLIYPPKQPSSSEAQGLLL